VTTARREGDKQTSSAEEMEQDLVSRDLKDQQKFLNMSDGTFDIFDTDNYDLVYQTETIAFEDMPKVAQEIVDAVGFKRDGGLASGALAEVEAELRAQGLGVEAENLVAAMKTVKSHIPVCQGRG